jgi:hypothetical protein
MHQSSGFAMIAVEGLAGSGERAEHVDAAAFSVGP